MILIKNFFNLLQQPNRAKKKVDKKIEKKEGRWKNGKDSIMNSSQRKKNVSNFQEAQEGERRDFSDLSVFLIFWMIGKCKLMIDLNGLSDGSLVGDVLVDAFDIMLILAVFVLTALHEVKKTRHADVYLLLMGKPALFCRKFAFSKGVVNAWFISEVVAETTFVALRTVIFIIKFAADVFGRIRLDDLAFNGVRKKAVKAVFAVAHVEMDAGIEASFHM